MNRMFRRSDSLFLNFCFLYCLETIFFLWKTLEVSFPLYLDIRFLGRIGGVSWSWSSSWSFSFSSFEEGLLELLEDMWASKTFTFGEGETGFSSSCDGFLTLVGWLGFAGSLAVTQGVLTWEWFFTPWNCGSRSLLDVGKGARVLDELHWDASLSLRWIVGCLKGWRRSTNLDLGSWYRFTKDLGSSYSNGDLYLD